ncbi:MAG: HAMP domain-containing histidine kinase [Elainella sp. Prado103]|jgi:hypothetical protein|nr:HAMP domain-containing histidine kinase [Elainella sp. Prado103]
MVDTSRTAESENQVVKSQQNLQNLQEQLEHTQLAYRMAQTSERFKAGFLARTAHELRSPLNSIMSLQQLILADLCEDPAEEREFISQAYAAAQKLLGLLDRLINVSKAVYGTEQLKIQPLCLEDIFMELESLLMLQAQNRNQHLQIEYPAPDIQVIADPRWLQQVLVSLVDTPMSLMREGVIRVIPQVDAAQQQVQIRIEDERPAEFWQEPIDLLSTLRDRGMLQAAEEEMTQMPSAPELAALTELGSLPSPGMSLIVNQMLLEKMGGSIEVLAVPTTAHPITCIQCTLMLATQE